MKRIQYGLSMFAMFGGISLNAMDQKELATWADQIEAVADALPKLANDLPQPEGNLLEDFTGEMFGVPGELRKLSGTLKSTICKMRAANKMPAIEKDIIETAKARFEWEMQYLRPGNRHDTSRDRNYIARYLGKLYAEKSGEISEEKVPYVPRIIDHMLNNRGHNDEARIILERARLASEFNSDLLMQKIITPRLTTHLQGMPEEIKRYISARIVVQLGARHFATEAVRQWLREQPNDDNAVDEQDAAKQKNSKKRPLDDNDSK
jgi:hypothetical protein